MLSFGFGPWQANLDPFGADSSSIAPQSKKPPAGRTPNRAVRSFDQEYRAKLLQFVTGTSKVPLDGFSSLQGTNGVQKFQVHRDYGANSRLPSAHTCFNQLDLPEYESYEQLREMLLKAINECSTGFGLV